MFESFEPEGSEKKQITTGKVFIVLGIVVVVAFVFVTHFIEKRDNSHNEDSCYTNVESSTINGQEEFTTKVVPCDCLPGKRDFWTTFHSCMTKEPEKYRLLTPGDGLSCEFSQDLSISMGSGLSGNINGVRNHFDCTDKTRKTISIELESVEPVDGKIEIKTKLFGTVLRGNEWGTLDKYEMTESQIAKLKKFLED
jgi:hypothetical protein